MPSRESARRTITQPEFEQLASFRYALRQFLRFSEIAAREVGLTPRQHEALLALRGSTGTSAPTVSDVAEWLQVRHHSAVGLLDRLEAKKLIRRRASKKDRRQVLISLTVEGNDLLDRLSRAHQNELRRIGPELVRALNQFGE